MFIASDLPTLDEMLVGREGACAQRQCVPHVFCTGTMIMDIVGFADVLPDESSTYSSRKAENLSSAKPAKRRMHSRCGANQMRSFTPADRQPCPLNRSNPPPINDCFQISKHPMSSRPCSISCGPPAQRRCSTIIRGIAALRRP